MIGPLSIGGGYQDDVDSCASDDDENAIIDVEDYKIPAITVNTAIPSTQTSSSGGGGGLSQSQHHHHHHSNNNNNSNSNNNNNNSSSNNHNNNGNGSSSSLTKNRIGRPTKSSLSSPVSSTASDDERLSPDSVKVRIILHTHICTRYLQVADDIPSACFAFNFHTLTTHSNCWCKTSFGCLSIAPALTRKNHFFWSLFIISRFGIS